MNHMLIAVVGLVLALLGTAATLARTFAARHPLLSFTFQAGHQNVLLIKAFTELTTYPVPPYTYQQEVEARKQALTALRHDLIELARRTDEFANKESRTDQRFALAGVALIGLGTSLQGVALILAP